MNYNQIVYKAALTNEPFDSGVPMFITFWLYILVYQRGKETMHVCPHIFIPIAGKVGLSEKLSQKHSISHVLKYCPF